MSGCSQTGSPIGPLFAGRRHKRQHGEHRIATFSCHSSKAFRPSGAAPLPKSLRPAWPEGVPLTSYAPGPGRGEAESAEKRPTREEENAIEKSEECGTGQRSVQFKGFQSSFERKFRVVTQEQEEFNGHRAGKACDPAWGWHVLWQTLHRARLSRWSSLRTRLIGPVWFRVCDGGLSGWMVRVDVHPLMFHQV